MSGFTPIRITKNDRKEYARLVKNAKAKIRRTKKNHGINLEGEVDLEPLENFSTRKEFNEWKNQVSSFTNRYNLNYQFVTNKHGVTENKANLQRLERENKRAIRKAQDEIDRIKDMQTKRAGEETGKKFGEKVALWADENRTGIHVPAPFDFDRFKSKYDYEKRKEKIEERSKPEYYNKRQVTFQDNFIKSLEGSFNSDADPLIDEIKSLPSKVFFELYIQNDEFDFERFVYDNEGVYDDSDMNDINAMMSVINKYKSGKNDTDLWGF